MENCQPAQSIEPADALAGSNNDAEDYSDAESESLLATSSSTSSEQIPCVDSEQGTSKEDNVRKRRRSSKVFVPVNKNNGKKQVLEKSLESLSKTLEGLSEAAKDNGTQELVDFLKEDAQRQEKRDEMFMRMMERVLMPPPQMQQPCYTGNNSFNTGNSYADPRSYHQSFSMYGASTNNNNIVGNPSDVFDRFLDQTK